MNELLTLKEIDLKNVVLASFFFRFYTYGDIPLETHLESIEELAFSKFDKLQVNTEIPTEPRWSSSVGATLHICCPILFFYLLYA